MVHISEIDHADYFSRLRPRWADQHIVIVGIAVNDAATQGWQGGNYFRLVKRKELFDERTLRRIPDVRQKLPNPTRSRKVPFQVPMRSRMREMRERDPHLP